MSIRFRSPDDDSVEDREYDKDGIDEFSLTDSLAKVDLLALCRHMPLNEHQMKDNRVTYQVSRGRRNVNEARDEA
jgi:hypothetical protein